ncbi:MAG: helix-turn-helix transcriptional regulator [Eubacteriales bacterium]|nr:helix-turn-helix transcriptional regulator [Candidatus Colimorpha enterica]
MTVINKELKKEIGNRLRDLRKERGLSIEGMIELLCHKYQLAIDEKTIRRYENGTYMPKIDNIITLSEFFEVPIDYLIFGKRYTDDDSYSWASTFKRLNRLILSSVLIPEMEDDKSSPFYGKYYFLSYDDEVSVYIERLICFSKDKNYSFEVRSQNPYFSILDYDNLIGDFNKYDDDLRPSINRINTVFKAAKIDPNKYLNDRLAAIHEKRKAKKQD